MLILCVLNNIVDDMTASKTLRTTCCIAGGGPAGMMLGFLLARAGIEVAVLEKHADFFRDFRGDTVHPSTLEVIHELGLLEDFLSRPHQKAHRLKGYIGTQEVVIAEFTHLKLRCPYIAFMPQWDFLDFLRDHAARLPNFHLYMSAEATGLIKEGEKVVGVWTHTREGEIEIRSTLTVAADGRHSKMRAAAGLLVDDLGAPMDVLWFALPRTPEQPNETLGFFKPGHIVALLNRQDYWQCAYVIPKGGAEPWKARPLEDFRQEIVSIVPFFAEHIHKLASWDDVKLLTVAVDRLREWSCPGFLCIGDAAHAMSPLGGVGINLAIQDAVAAANILSEPLKKGTLTLKDLQNVQKRRNFPTKATQWLQLVMQDRVIRNVLSGRPFASIPWQVKLLQRSSWLCAIPAYIVGVGFRPEHVKEKWRE